MNSKKQIAGKIGAAEKKKKKEPMLVVAATIGGNENNPNAELNESFPVSQKEEESARINLAENDSVSQKEEESRNFHKELDQQLSSRMSSPELLEAHKIITDKDSIIEKLRKENEDLLKQHNTTSHKGQNIAIQQQEL